MTAEELYKLYVAFGPDPFVVPLNPKDPDIEFSAWTYAKERCKELVRLGDLQSALLTRADIVCRGAQGRETAPSEQLFFLIAVKEGNYSVKDFLGCSFYISFGPFPKRSGKEPFNRRFVA